MYVLVRLILIAGCCCLQDWLQKSRGSRIRTAWSLQWNIYNISIGWIRRKNRLESPMEYLQNALHRMD